MHTFRPTRDLGSGTACGGGRWVGGGKGGDVGGHTPPRPPPPVSLCGGLGPAVMGRDGLYQGWGFCGFWPPAAQAGGCVKV